MLIMKVETEAAVKLSNEDVVEILESMEYVSTKSYTTWNIQYSENSAYNKII